MSRLPVAPLLRPQAAAGAEPGAPHLPDGSTFAADDASRMEQPYGAGTPMSDAEAPAAPMPTVPPEPPADADARSASVKRRFLHSLAWSAGSRWLTQLLTWGSTIVVARLLSPDDYGLIGFATLYMGLVAIVSEMGFGSAIVVLRDLSDDQVAQINTVSVGLGVAAFLLSVALAVPLGYYFRSPNLPPVLIALSVTFVVSGIRAVPLSLIQRDLGFRNLSLWEAASSVVAASSAIALAIAGAGYWALAVSQIAGVVCITALTVFARRHHFARPQMATLRGVFVFSNRMLVNRFAWYAYSNADFLVVGRVLGQAALGSYTFAWTLVTLPGEKIATLLNSLTPAFFSAVRADRDELQRYLLTITEATSLAVLPATLGIGLVAREIVPAVFGDHWRSAVPVLEALAAFGVLRAIQPLIVNALASVGDMQVLMWQAVTAAVVYPAAFFLASRWGPVAVALTWAVLFPVEFAFGVWRIDRVGVTPSRAYLRSLWPAASSGLVMCAVVLGVKLLLRDSALPVGARAAIEIVAGAGAYTLALLVLHRARVTRLVRLVKETRRSGSAATPTSPVPAVR